MTEILITGTDGFIGGMLKEYLSQQTDFHITGTAFFKPPQENEIKFNITHLEDFKLLPEKNFDVIIHTVGIVDQSVSKEKMFAVNCEGTKNLLNWIQKHPCKHFIQLSSITVYGLKTMGVNHTEANTPRYMGKFFISYGRSKAKAETYIEQSHLPYTLLRCPSVMGSNDTFTSEAIIPRLQNDTFFFASSKNPLFSMLYVKNLGPIIQRLIELGPQNDAFNCTDFSVPWKEFILEYCRILNITLHERKKCFLAIIWHVKDRMYDYLMVNSLFGAHFPNDKLMAKLQIIPSHPWQEGVKEAADAYFVRLAKKKQLKE